MSLRMVEMVVSGAAAAGLASLSEEQRILGLWREPLQDDFVLLRVLVRSEKAEAVIHELESRFQASPGFRLVIFEVAATGPTPEDDSATPDRSDATEPADDAKKDPQRIACAELVEKLSAVATVNRVYALTVFLSTVVAAIGLIRGNLAVIIGAMVIAPLLGPNMTLSLATTLGDLKLARRALRVNAVGLFLALLLAVLVGLLSAIDPGAAEIRSRTEVALTDVVLALAAGSAGALAFTTGLSAALVGVMVAVALLPPLVTTGLLLGAGQRVGRQQHLRFDQDERGGHVQEICGDVDVQLFELVEVVQILTGDFGDGDVVDVHLLLADQVEQQIERAFVGFDVHVVGRRNRTSTHCVPPIPTAASGAKAPRGALPAWLKPCPYVKRTHYQWR